MEVMSTATVVVKAAPKATKKAPAAKSRLAEGEHSIDRANVRVLGNSKFLDWRIRLPGEAKPKKVTSQISKDKSNAELKAKAKLKAEEILRTGGMKAEWKKTSSFGEFARQVVTADIEKAGVAARTKDQYRGALRLLIGDCDKHTHARALGRRTIAAAVKYDVLEDCLLEISELHGAETARQSRTVLSGYLLKALKRRSLIQENPIRGEKIDLKTNARPHGGRTGGVALSLADYHRVLEYLIGLDPAEGIEKPKRGRWTLADRIAKRRNAIDLALLQAGTGLRVNEARQVWRDLMLDDADRLRVNVVAEIAKGGIPRISRVLDLSVAARLRGRLAMPGAGSDPLIGSPYSESKFWDHGNLTDVNKLLYLEIGEKLQIAAFEKERTHIWRATLHTLLKGTMPDAMLEAQFGHSKAVANAHYLDKTMTDEYAEAAEERLAKG